jgi:hypothetical protein
VMLLVAVVGAFLASRLPARLVEGDLGEEVPLGDAVNAGPTGVVR